MKNEKAFTLVELLATIIILLLLATIITPTIIKQFNHAEDVTYKTQINEFINTAKIYMNNNSEKIPDEDDIFVITYQDLKEADLVNNNEMINPKTQEPLSGCIIINYDQNKYNYNYIESENMCNRALMIVTSGDGIYASKLGPLRFIYRGANPNNYIWLDENKDTIKQGSETYRIISYESDGTIKVIRDTSIGNYAWDERTDITTGPRHNTNNTYCNYTGTYYGCNVWGTQESTYYNDTTLTNLNQDFYYKYYPNNNATTLQNHPNSGTITEDASLNTYLNGTWYNTLSFKEIIDNHSFNVGGIYYISSYTGGDKGLEKEKEEQNIYTWNGKIGLMNITEYVDASLNPTCTNVYSNFYYNSNYYYDTNGDGTKEQTISGYDNWPCSNRSYNWLPKSINEWSLSPNSSTRNNVWIVGSSGYFGYNVATYTYGVRPVFYLKSSVVLTGTGTITDPYIIESY